MGTFICENGEFYLDGKPFSIRSGAIHYFRIPREYWHDRLLKLRECGFNTVETYTPWNLHERREGEFDFSGILDIEAFLDEAESLGLYVILRPGPYICAEWDMGGLPSWLLSYEKISLRTENELFLSKVRRYYRELLARVRPRLITNGGNIIMLQIENEYGSFGNDHGYVRRIAELYRTEGMDCLLFTSDGPTYTMLSGGSLPEYIPTANFGSHPGENLEFLRKYRPDAPLMCCEYWCGWFDHWYEEHHVRPPEEVYENICEFLDMEASFNIYMFCGGTNFAFTSGANYDKIYQPTTTSYDYNAPLSEAGDRTELYWRIRRAVEKKLGALPEATAKESEKRAYGKVTLSEYAPLFKNLHRISSPISSPEPLFMEDVGQDFGYILYRTTLEGPTDGWEMHIDTVHDRAQIFEGETLRGVCERRNPDSKENTHIGFGLKEGESTCLSILCENMGRVNYGPKIKDRKGISGVRFGNCNHFGWQMYPLPMTDLSTLEFESAPESVSTPTFLRGKLTVEGAPCDTFLRLPSFTKGFVMINGNNIGRYFNPAGPQKTLYVPAPFLKSGGNEIIVFESDGAESFEIEFIDTPIL